MKYNRFGSFFPYFIKFSTDRISHGLFDTSLSMTVIRDESNILVPSTKRAYL